MTYYPRSAYGSQNPNAGYPANGNAAAWGGYQWTNCPPSSLLANTNYTNRTNGQTISVKMRKELVPLWNLIWQIMDQKHGYPVWASKGGENWGPWGFECRSVSGTNNPSGHSMALSVDINAPYNPYSYTFQSDMPPAMVADIESLGMYWGGRYEGQKYDAMHYGFCRTPNTVQSYITKAQQILGSAPTPPDPTPEPEEDDDVYRTYQPSAGPDSGGIWIAGPGFCDVIPSMEYYDTLVKVGAAKPVTSVSQREFDVLKDSYRRFPHITSAADVWNFAITSKVTNAPCGTGDMLAYTNLHTEPGYSPSAAAADD